MDQKLNTRERRKERLDRGIKVRTEGLYALSSWREMGYLLLPRLLLILGLLSLPLWLDMYWQRVLCQAGIYALLALGFDFLAEYVGLVCLGGAFFIGAGGYISGLLNAYSIKAPANNGIVSDAVTETDSITFPIAGVKAGNYLLRIQVDGAESPLQVSADPANPKYNSPQVSIP